MEINFLRFERPYPRKSAAKKFPGHYIIHNETHLLHQGMIEARVDGKRNMRTGAALH